MLAMWGEIARLQEDCRPRDELPAQVPGPSVGV